ncbi:MAG: hypothetical protein IJC74_08980 [Clostridia bacterium]|nr:hypothetical protein [Clostridia bacterium]
MSYEKYTEVTVSLENSTIDRIIHLAEKFKYHSYVELMQKMVAYGTGDIYGNPELIVEFPGYYVVSDEMEGAYTGLVGADGNFIYEGDILKHDDVIGVVIFDKGAFMYHEKGTRREDNITLFEFLDKEYDYKIIGNIRKTPYLYK